MRVINLFSPNDDIAISRFSGGECHVKVTAPIVQGESIRINTRLNSSDDILTFCLAVDALRNMGATHIEAFIPYIPYARQDRVMVPGEPLSVKVFSALINALQLNKIYVFDAHSDVSVALLNNCVNIPNHDMAAHCIGAMDIKDFMLVSPDLGAYKKVDKLAQKLGKGYPIATGIKIRDLSTGEIKRTELNTADLNGRDCVVVDDICDGGRTFIELSTAMKNRGAGKLHLIVSHGIFSHGALENLQLAGYETVSSSNSIASLPQNSFYREYALLP